MRNSNAVRFATLMAIAVGEVTGWTADKATDARPERFEIRSRCVDEAGQAVVDAEVLLVETEFTDKPPLVVGKTRTNELGEFAFTDLEPPTSDPPTKQRHYTVCARHPRYASDFTRYSTTEPVKTKDLVLAQKSGALTGRVTNERGEPLVGADVFFASADGHAIPGFMHAVTDQDGRYEIADLRLWDANDPNSIGPIGIPGARSCLFSVKYPGYPTTRPRFGAIPSEVNVKVVPGIMIKGRVIDGSSGQSVGGAVVQAQGIKEHGWDAVTTDRLGRYLLILPDDQYNIRALAPERISIALDSFAGRVGDTTEAPDLKLIAGGFIEGRVVDPFLKLPVHRLPASYPIHIAHYGPAYPKSSAAVGATTVRRDGTYRLHVAPGKNRVYIMIPGIEVSRSGPGAADRGGVTVHDGETVTLDFEVDVSKARLGF
jgi:hypothetical protein